MNTVLSLVVAATIALSPAHATEQDNFTDNAQLDTSQVMSGTDTALIDSVCMCDDAALWWRGYFDEGDWQEGF